MTSAPADAIGAAVALAPAIASARGGGGHGGGGHGGGGHGGGGHGGGGHRRQRPSGRRTGRHHCAIPRRWPGTAHLKRRRGRSTVGASRGEYTDAEETPRRRLLQRPGMLRATAGSRRRAWDRRRAGRRVRPWLGPAA